MLIRNIITDNTKSCGCYNLEAIKERSTKHGSSTRGNREKIYIKWLEMRRRCYTETAASYKNYGGRGITICDEWENFVKFKEWALSNGYSDELSIERKDVNGNYCPGNCTWIPFSKQSENRRTCRYIEFNGENKTISEWYRTTGIPRGTIYRRLKENKELEEVFKIKHTL